LVPSGNIAAAREERDEGQLAHRVSKTEQEERGDARRYGSGCENLCTSFSASLSSAATARGSRTLRLRSNWARISIALLRHRSRRTYL